MTNMAVRSLIAASLGLAPGTLLAQDAGVSGTLPLANPAPVVRAALGGATPRLSRSARQRTAPANDVIIPLVAARGQCFEVLGYATGATRVSVEVELRGVPVASEVVLSNSLGGVGRGSFCAPLGGVSYELRVRAPGPAWWQLALLPVPATSSVDAGAADATATDAVALLVEAPRAPASARFALGGAETDYVAGQLRSMARARSLLAALGAAERFTLETNGFRDITAMVPSGQCVELLASGVPSVGDLTLELYDPTGNRVAQDASHLGAESVRYCPSYAGVYRGRVRVFSGAGLVAAQLMSAQR